MMAVGLPSSAELHTAIRTNHLLRHPGGLSDYIAMRSYTAVIEHCPDTQLYVGYVPGFPGAHSQGRTLDELHSNLLEVLAMLLEEGTPVLESEFVGIQTLEVNV